MQRVPDGVRRESYSLLRKLGIERVPAKLDDCFLRPDCWESLSALGLLG